MTPVEKKRQQAGRQKPMFLRMIWRGAMVRRGRALTALLAVAVAAAVTTTLLNLYVDAQAKLRTEFRNYGANVVVVAPDGSSLPADALSKVEAVIGSRGMAVPVAYAVAKAGSTPVVVVGTDLERAKQMNRWWQVKPESFLEICISPCNPAAVQSLRPLHAIFGTRVMAALSPKSAVNFVFADRVAVLMPTATLKTGGAEDNHIYLDLPDFTRWTGVQPSTIEIAVSGSTSEIDSTMKRLDEILNPSLPNDATAGAPSRIDVRPVRQIMEGEAHVLGKTRAALLGSTAIVIAVAALCVLATLMSWVLDRKKDFAVMKALGASEGLLKGLFAAEASLIGAVGAAAGFAVGVGAAVWIGRANFHSPVVPRLGVFPEVLAGGIVVALLAALLPISFLRSIQPAVILRGE